MKQVKLVWQGKAPCFWGDRVLQTGQTVLTDAVTAKELHESQKPWFCPDYEKINQEQEVEASISSPVQDGDEKKENGFPDGPPEPTEPLDPPDPKDSENPKEPEKVENPDDEGEKPKDPEMSKSIVEQERQKLLDLAEKRKASIKKKKEGKSENSD